MRNMVNVFKSQIAETLQQNLELVQFTACDCGGGPVDCCVVNVIT